MVGVGVQGGECAGWWVCRVVGNHRDTPEQLGVNKLRGLRGDTTVGPVEKVCWEVGVREVEVGVQGGWESPGHHRDTPGQRGLNKLRGLRGTRQWDP